MLLRIIDKLISDKQNHSIEIELTSNGQSKSFVTDFFPSSFSETLKKDLAWYFGEYLQSGLGAGDDRSAIDRLLNHGKYMGDRVVGDDLQLISYRETIEDIGYQHLSVSIESVRIGFFEEPWETLILPDSKYVLSSVTKSFVRSFGRSDAAIEYELSKEDPLRILHAVCLPGNSISSGRFASSAYTSANELLQYDGAVECELWGLDDRTVLMERLTPSSAPVHIFRYDGPLVYRQGMFYLSLNREWESSDISGAVELADLVKQLAIVKCALFILNPSEWICDSRQPMPADTGLALVAQIALSAGIPSVLGLSSVTDPWTSGNCLSIVYKNFFKGLSLAQAVVEARKELQSQTQSDLLCFSPQPFQSWPLLVHYENRSVVFFSSPQTAVDIPQTHVYANLRRRMHGFYSEFLPPYATISGDSALFECLRACKSDSGVTIHIFGGQGIGKTQLLHMLAFYLTRGICEQAFYFDYAEYFYTADDIKEMITPVLNGQADSRSEDGSGSRYIFMLDNLESHGYGEIEDFVKAGLGQYLGELTASRHIVVMTGVDSSIPFTGGAAQPAIQIALQPLSSPEQRHMTTQLFKKQDVDAGQQREAVQVLLERCRGNPFLIKHVMPKFVADSYQALAANVDGLFGEEGISSCVNIFHAWQWREFPVFLKRRLIMLAGLRGVILEMLAVVCDANDRFEPVSEFYQTIGGGDVTFSEGIAMLEEAGFTLQYPIGRVLNPRCIPFINTQAGNDPVIADCQEALTLQLSRIVCRSLAIVIPEVLKKTDQLIIQNLVSNRGQWAKHLEVVWKAGEYEEFWSALSPLSELLKRVRLSEELALWVLRLISIDKEVELQTKLSSPAFLKIWVKLVSLALGAGEATNNPAIRQTAESCDQWIRSVATEQVSGQASLFTGIVQFLQMYYQAVPEWGRLEGICEIALREYYQHEVWPLAVTALSLLIECGYEKGDIAMARAYEQQLLNDIPMDDFPTGFNWQLKTKVITNQLARGELNAAQELLDHMHIADEDGQRRRLLEMFQADIYFRQDRLEDADVLYRTLLESMDSVSGTAAHKEFFERRCAEIADRLETEKITDPV